MRPQISRGAVKEQTRLSRSSDIIPVLQVKTQIKRETNVCSTAVALLQCMDKGKVLIVMQFENLLSVVICDVHTNVKKSNLRMLQ